MSRQQSALAVRYLAGMLSTGCLRTLTAACLCGALLSIMAVGRVTAQNQPPAPAGQAHDSATTTARWDTHPIVLAFIQLAAVLAAAILFPRPGVTRLNWLDEDFRTVFRRSYRASFFGS